MLKIMLFDFANSQYHDFPFKYLDDQIFLNVHINIFIADSLRITITWAR